MECRKGILQETGMFCGFLEAGGGKGNGRKNRDELWKWEVYDENKEA